MQVKDLSLLGMAINMCVLAGQMCRWCGDIAKACSSRSPCVGFEGGLERWEGTEGM